MIKIEIHPNSVRSITAKSGKQFRIQEAYAVTLDQSGAAHKYPERFVFFVGDKDQPAAPGVYSLSPASIYVDRRGNLSVAPKLLPVSRG